MAFSSPQKNDGKAQPRMLNDNRPMEDPMARPLTSRPQNRNTNHFNEPSTYQSQFPYAGPQNSPQMMQQPILEQHPFVGQTYGTNFGLNPRRAQPQEQIPWGYQQQQVFNIT
ncbi:unnamed protein product, partial [Mesorhabditis belari]|uniref:Uncharacterized protein n=1 Tax=Mesorhabditis belari TaxID=2138241 RepID=A0AAF3F3J0_9BILA